MKNFFLGILVSIILIGTIATSVPNSFITVIPATPKYTVTFNDYYPEIFVSSYAKQGYQVITSCSRGTSGKVFVVMVKY